MARSVRINYEANNKREFFMADNDVEIKLIKAVIDNDSKKFSEEFFRSKQNKLYQKLLDLSGKSLVMIAVEKAIIDSRYIDILDTLLSYDIESNILDNTNRTPLYIAAEAGNREIVQKLLDTSMYKVDKHHENYGTALFAAIKNGHLKIAELLMQNGGNLNIHPFPLEEVIKSNSVETLKYFIELSKNNTSTVTNTSLILTSEVFEKFSQSFQESFWNNKVLRLAAQNNQSVIFDWLVEQFIINNKILAIKSAISNDKNVLSKIFISLEKEEKLLNILIEENKIEFFKFLLDKFINDLNIDVIEKLIENVCKIDSNNLDVIKILVDYIAQFGKEYNVHNLLHSKNKDSNNLEIDKFIKDQLLDHSFLELATKCDNYLIVDKIVQYTLINGDLKIVKSLLEFANKNKYLQIKLADGLLLTTALQSTSKDKFEIVKALVQNGSSISALDYELAANNKDLTICAYLKEKAAPNVITEKVIKDAKQNYDSKIKSLFGSLEITNAGSLLKATQELAKYIDPDTTNPLHSLEIHAQLEESAFSSLLGENSHSTGQF